MSAPIDWGHYRKCPVCAAAIGAACTTLTATVVDGNVVGAADVPRARPHSRRKLRTGYARTGGDRG